MSSSYAIALPYLCAIALSCPSPAISTAPADFDARVKSLRKSLGVPGVAIVVENGKIR